MKAQQVLLSILLVMFLIFTAILLYHLQTLDSLPIPNPQEEARLGSAKFIDCLGLIGCVFADCLIFFFVLLNSEELPKN